MLPVPSAVSDLSFSVIGLRNPVRAGKELRYEIRVVNKGTIGYGEIRVTATFPDGLTPVALGTVGPGGANVRIEDRTVRFDPVEIAANASLTFDVPCVYRPTRPAPCRRRVDRSRSERAEKARDDYGSDRVREKGNRHHLPERPDQPTVGARCCAKWCLSPFSLLVGAADPLG